MTNFHDEASSKDDDKEAPKIKRGLRVGMEEEEKVLGSEVPIPGFKIQERNLGVNEKVLGNEIQIPGLKIQGRDLEQVLANEAQVPYFKIQGRDIRDEHFQGIRDREMMIAGPFLFAVGVVLFVIATYGICQGVKAALERRKKDRLFGELAEEDHKGYLTV